MSALASSGIFATRHTDRTAFALSKAARTVSRSFRPEALIRYAAQSARPAWAQSAVSSAASSADVSAGSPTGSRLASSRRAASGVLR